MKTPSLVGSRRKTVSPSCTVSVVGSEIRAEPRLNSGARRRARANVNSMQLNFLSGIGGCVCERHLHISAVTVFSFVVIPQHLSSADIAKVSFAHGFGASSSLRVSPSTSFFLPADSQLRSRWGNS